MRVRFWRGRPEPLPELRVDRTADRGVAPLDESDPVEGPPPASLEDDSIYPKFSSGGGIVPRR